MLLNRMLRRMLGKLHRRQEGMVLVIVLVLMVMGGLLIVPTLSYASTSLNALKMTEANTHQLYAADSGVEEALHWLMTSRVENIVWTWTEDEETGLWSGERASYPMNDSYVRITVEELGNSTFKVISEATRADGHTMVLSSAYVVCFFAAGTEFSNQNPPPPGDIHFEGDATMVQQATITGNVTAAGDLSLSQGAAIEGSANIDGDLTVGQACTITGDVVCVTGDIDGGQAEDIVADVHFLGDDCSFITPNSASVTGNILADGNLTINMANTAVVNGDIWANGNLTINMSNSATINGDVYATGHIWLYLNHPQCEITGTVYYDPDLPPPNPVITKHAGAPDPVLDVLSEAPLWVAGIAPCPDSSIGVDIISYVIT